MNKPLLKKYLNNTCNDTELEQVKRFLQKPGSEDLFHEVLNEAWQEMDEPDLDKQALDYYRSQIIQKKRGNNDRSIKLWSKQWLKYAAILILPITFGLIKWLETKENKVNEIEIIETYNPRGQRSIIMLPDSTIIYLGSNSKIKYPKTFSNTREMELIGEAFFKVKRDPKRPFIIHTKNIQTKVLGTSFKIEAFQGHPLQVSVATGKVRVDRKDNLHKNRLNSVAVLTPGHLVNWDEETQKASFGEVAIEEIDLWKDGNLTFNNKRLEDVANVLERCYNVDINFMSNALANYRINTSCSLNEPVTKIMEIMAKTANFRYKIENNQITVSNKQNR